MASVNARPCLSMHEELLADLVDENTAVGVVQFGSNCGCCAIGDCRLGFFIKLHSESANVVID
jgi:hypothetical protein